MNKLLPLFIVLLGAVVASQAQELKTEFQDTQPKFILNSDGSFSGICVELIQLIEKNSSIKFIYPKQFIPAKRMEQNIVHGITDVQLGYGKTPEREKNLIFSEVLYEVNYILIANIDDNIDASTIDEIKMLGNDCIVLAVSGTANASTMKKYGLTVDSGNGDVDANLQKLLAKRGRLFAYHDLGLLYKINKPQYKGKFKILPIVVEKTEHWIAFSHKTPQSLINYVADTIKKLKKNGEWARVTSKYLN